LSDTSSKDKAKKTSDIVFNIYTFFKAKNSEQGKYIKILPYFFCKNFDFFLSRQNNLFATKANKTVKDILSSYKMISKKTIPLNIHLK